MFIWLRRLIGKYYSKKNRDYGHNYEQNSVDADQPVISYAIQDQRHLRSSRKSPGGDFDLKNSKVFSLQTQYIIFTFALVIVIVLAILFSRINVAQNYRALSTHSRHTAFMLEQLVNIKDHINKLINGIDIVMLEPENMARIDNIFDRSITEINQSLEKLTRGHLVHMANISKETDSLVVGIKNFRQVSRKLFDLRINEDSYYRSWTVTNNSIAPASNAIFSIFATLANEIENKDALGKPNTYYDLVLHGRYIWVKLVSEYRLFILHRSGVFNERDFHSQEELIGNLIQQFKVISEQLSRYENDNGSGIQSTTITSTLSAHLEEWVKGFLTVQELHHSGAQNNNLDFLKSEMIPLINEINQTLVDIDAKIVSTSTRNANNLIQIGKQQTLLLGGLICLNNNFQFLSG